ncbi:ExbD/TolR family protein [Leptospira stimsonii]|uniref:Biopolymer transporter ExbD n=1 Tax=Leptospira stimsonii TaxID=2202203 RepID=A0A4R9L712_9LEPT|nr:biopolymer transporter ExbD [Leptospira stimsonii]RHX83453.1 biopolymer transporter ExbD [Leptospira stimsonii]TGK20488.1 biopolymer transporter ExbD [Leptospira stimsonii]TGM14278.1 biopolymer transporter ExbD [Leptospira stimsonii]
MKSGTKKRKSLLDGEDSPLDMTSMLDVVFILLIFAMVAMSFQKEVHSLPVRLPKSNAEAGGVSSKKEIYLLKEGILRYEGKDFSKEEWKQIVSKEEFRESVLWVYGDEEADYGRFVFIVDSLKNAGLKELHLAVKKE